MPIEITNLSDEDGIASVDSFLEEDGEPTLQAVVIREFLDEVDFSHLFDLEQLREFVEVADGYAKFDTELDAYVECKEDDEGAELVLIETINGEDLENVVDEDDLSVMFEYYLENEHPFETLEDKLRLAVFGYGDLDESDLEGDEEGLSEAAKGPFKKGAFRKMHKQPGGPAMVNRMLGAMLHKESVKRATAPGKGYKGGDYTKAAGYAPGTSKGVKKWKKYLVAKSAQVAKEAKKTKKAVKIGGKKIGGKKKIVKKAAVKKIIPAKKQSKGKAGKKSLKAHDDNAVANVSEGTGVGLRAHTSMDPTDIKESTTLTKRILSGMAVKSE